MTEKLNMIAALLKKTIVFSSLKDEEIKEISPLLRLSASKTTNISLWKETLQTGFTLQQKEGSR